MRDAMTQLGGDPDKINPMVILHPNLDSSKLASMSFVVIQFGVPAFRFQQTL